MQDLFTVSTRGISTCLAWYKPPLYVLICLLWILPGLIGRDPWHPDELVLTAVIANMAKDGTSWVPLLLGDPFVEMPPLYLWLAAGTARATAWFLPAHEGARLINVILLVIGLAFIRLCAGRYGALTGWMAVLLAIGTTGFMIRAHLLNAELASFAAAAALLWGALKLHTHAVTAGVVVGLAIGFLFMSVGIMTATAAVLALCVFLVGERHSWRRLWDGLATAFFFALPGLFIWPALLAFISPEYYSLWLDNSFSSPINSISIFFTELLDYIKTSSWSLFPVLPIVICGLFYLGRSYVREDVVFLCLCLLVTGSILFIIKGGGEEDFFFVLPALAVAAARALQRLPGNAAVVLDWFALLILGLCFAGAMWVLWLCFFMGMPVSIIDYINEYFLGFTMPAEFSYWAVAFAAVITASWVALVLNFGLSNERAAVNWSCGVAAIWLIFNVLWVDYVDSGKSYRNFAEAVKGNLAGGCLRKTKNTYLLAQMDYFGVSVGRENCHFMLVLADIQETITGELIWTGGRTEKRQYRLYRL